jgi:dihydrofolate synthase / folylpolyglutamate synthase
VIDYDRMPRIYARIKSLFSLPKIIHIVGTNAKGSSGRYLALALHRLGFDTGHYSSPHILKLNERIWRQNSNASDHALENAHQWLLSHLDTADAEALSYFEYTTLLAMRVFEGCDYVVLEAGLGGEHDATNVFEKVLSLFTPIDYDHQAFLGDSIEAIATTKMRSMAAVALCARQPHAKSYEVCNTLATQRGARVYDVEKMLEPAHHEAIMELVQRQHLPKYMSDNISNAWAALMLLGFEPKASLFDATPLFGRMTPLRENIFLDVGHNPLAAQAIVGHFKDQKIRLVYNTYADKDYAAILTILKPIVACVEIIAIESQRRAVLEVLKERLDALEMEYEAHLTCKNEHTYLVFGSFSVAEAFLALHPELKPHL